MWRFDLPRSRSTVDRVARGGIGASGEPDLIRAVVPGVAVVVLVVAAVSDPAGWREFGLLLLAAVAFLFWSRRPRLPVLVLSAAVLVPVVASQHSGALEPAMFLVSLLAIVIAGWAESTMALAVAGVAALASPLVAAALAPEGQGFAWGIWMMGIAFPALIGLVFRRQQVLATQLLQAQGQLAEQAVDEERRQIARDVHDLVGHGLAAMLLQVTSARHVLRRDADSADEALQVAEDVGRQSMLELRRTVALLRSEGDSAVTPPLPGLAGVGALIDAARAGGLQVEYTASGEHNGVDPGAGLAVYRIAQESLVNAARHAPQARTLVSTSVEDRWVALEVESIGPLPSKSGPDSERRGYGLQGMRERAEGAGGTLQTGPKDGGWLVRCRVPLAGRVPATDEAAAP